MVELTDADKRILDGEHGEVKRKALELLLTLARIYDADSLVPVASAHINGASVMAIGEAGVGFVEEMANDGASIVIPATTNPKSLALADKDVGLDPAQATAQKRLSAALHKMGAQVCSSCTPYLVGNVPAQGQSIAWAESSAIVYANSVLGARSNREGGPTAIASAILGKTIRTGYHLDENRAGTLLVQVRKPLSGTTAYGTLGYFVGGIAKDGVPVFEGLPPSVTADELKMLSAALATAGSVAMFHIVGVTPEAQTREHAFRGRKPPSVLEYGNLEEAAGVSALTRSGSDKTEWVTLGCPHFSVSEFAHAASLLAGQKISSEVMLWINSSAPVASQAAQLGYIKVIEEAGGEIVCETCPVHIAGRVFARRQNITNLTTNSAKMAHYAFGQLGLYPRYGTIDECIRAAITGSWNT
jgi:predicted aconitase